MIPGMAAGPGRVARQIEQVGDMKDTGEEMTGQVRQMHCRQASSIQAGKIVEC